ncbi:MAG: excinuclease ABC subunit UvrC [Spirochaetota bacterium]
MSNTETFLSSISEDISKTINNLPQKPGVYLMKDREGNILYIGKAKNIKKRVSSYFHHKNAGLKTEAMVSHIDTIDTIITDNEVEALILENNLIKKYKPRFNIELKENNTYPYLKITNETFPRLLKTRIRVNDSGLYFGPYTRVKYLNRTIKTLTDIFPIRRCKANLDRVKKSSPCINYYLGKCACPCCGLIDPASYSDIVNQVIYFLKGQNQQLINHIRQEMEKEAKNKRFEQAIQLRERLKALKHLFSEQKITTDQNEDQDIIGIAEYTGGYTVTMLLKRKGNIIGKRDFSIGSEESRDDVVKQFLTLAYDQISDLPTEILLPFHLEDEKILESYFKKKYGKSIHIAVPVRGVKKRLVELAFRNASQKSSEKMFAHDSVEGVRILKKVLSLKKTPRLIEAFDVANTLGYLGVAGMVRFSDGVPDKSNYRRFRIKFVEQQNDVEMLKEATARHYQRILNEKGELPDLVLVDGGSPQVQGVRQVLDALGLENIPLLGLAKKHEEIYTDSGSSPLRLEKSNHALRLLMAIRDEAHRFANAYHIKLRGRKALSSELLSIRGIGEKLTHTILKSIDKGQPLTLDSLMKIKGVGKKRAMEILKIFQKK